MAKTKAFLSAFLIALMINGLAIFGTGYFGKAPSGTNVSSIISSAFESQETDSKTLIAI